MKGVFYTIYAGAAILAIRRIFRRISEWQSERNRMFRKCGSTCDVDAILIFSYTKQETASKFAQSIWTGGIRTFKYMHPMHWAADGSKALSSIRVVVERAARKNGLVDACYNVAYSISVIPDHGETRKQINKLITEHKLSELRSIVSTNERKYIDGIVNAFNSVNGTIDNKVFTRLYNPDKHRIKLASFPFLAELNKFINSKDAN